MKRRLFLLAVLVGTAFMAVSCGAKNSFNYDISPKMPDPTAAHKGPKAVFIGDSITWQWGLVTRKLNDKQKQEVVIPDPLPTWMKISGDDIEITWHASFFTSNNYVDKGKSGERTDEMLKRYQSDVLSQDPFCVVIMGGTNDLAQGYSKDQILSNIKSMAEKAAEANMKVVLCSVTPCNMTYSRLTPHEKGPHIVALNKMIKEYAAEKGFTYCDYYPALVAEDGYSLKDEYCLYDKLHPNPDAYTVMEEIIQKILK